MPEVIITDAGRDQVGYLPDFTATAPDWFGSPGPGSSEFRAPRAVARLNGGFLIVDTGNHRLVAIDDASGGGWQAFGSHGSGAGQFNQPAGVAVDSSSRIYVSDAGNRRVVRIDGMDGTGWVAFGTGGTPTPADPAVGKFRQPAGLATDGEDGLWVADTHCSRVVHVESMAGAGWFAFPADGPLAVTCEDNGQTILVGAIGAKQVSRHNAATGALTAATPAFALAVPAAVQVLGTDIVALDTAARRLLGLSGTLAQVSTEVHLADLGFQWPVGMVVW
jgi:DNA-binding beta-propeller fold protein YncE